MNEDNLQMKCGTFAQESKRKNMCLLPLKFVLKIVQIWGILWGI
jgi:hypothetical protein